MNTEQKAKAYDKVLEKANALYKAAEPMSGCNVILETLFPELKESEDERIRKELIKFVKVNIPDEERYIAWLEKQGDKCLVNFDEAEKEKYDFVSGQYIECRASFNEFKENNSYWLEYIGNDTYIGRSDNILNQKFHITPRQLYRLFSQQHCPKEDNTNEEINAPIEYGKYVDECLNEASKHFFSEGEDKYSVADLFYAGVRCGKSWLEKQGEQKYAWSEEDERMIDNIIDYMKPMPIFFESTKGKSSKEYTKEFIKEAIKWLKSLKDRCTWKPSDGQIKALKEACDKSWELDGLDPLYTLYDDLKKIKG